MKCIFDKIAGMSYLCQNQNIPPNLHEIIKDNFRSKFCITKYILMSQKLILSVKEF